MSKTIVAKKIAKFVVGGSVSYTIANVIKNNVSPEKPFQAVEAVIGGCVVGLMVAEAAEEYTDKQIDALVTWWNETFTTKTINTVA